MELPDVPCISTWHLAAIYMVVALELAALGVIGYWLRRVISSHYPDKRVRTKKVNSHELGVESSHHSSRDKTADREN